MLHVTRWAVAVAASTLVLSNNGRAGEPPHAADLRADFDAQFPKSAANGTALDLEELAAAIGIDLAPRALFNPDKPNETPPPPDDGRTRPAPGTENRLAFQDFLQKELAVTTERIGRAAPPVERFLEERDGEISRIESLLLTHEEPRWEIDVGAEAKAPIPNLLGILRLQRLLLTRALVLGREGRTEDALETMEASWRLQGAVVSRPELISQLIAIAVARFQAGVLRKIDSPAYGWSERLRSPGAGVEGYEAALQNEGWFFPARADPKDELFSRGMFETRRAFLAEVEKEDLCSWTPDGLEAMWQDAASGIENETIRSVVAEVAWPNISNGLLRARQVAIDSELTALILDARAERAAQRRPHWSGRLLTLGTGVCPEVRWSYRVNSNGTARFAFEGRLEGSNAAPFQLPLEFTAGKAKPAKVKIVPHVPLAPGR